MIARPVMPPTIVLWVGRGRTWWEERQARERLLLAGLAALLAIFLILNVFWRPVYTARQNALTEIRLYDALAVRLRAAGPTLRAPTGAVQGGTPQAVVTATAGEASLAIRQIEQQGAETRVVLDGVDFVRLVQWLERLERQTAPGVVNARVSLVRR